MKALVRNGRLLLNEPTELPEGEIVEIVELVQLDDVLADDDNDLDDEERAALDFELEASFTAEAAGELIDAADVIDEILRRRGSRQQL
jgi:hypothetical protein